MTAAELALEPALDRGRQRLALVTISGAQLLFLLDATVVNVALPNIQRSLGFSGNGLEWVVTAYSIAFGGLLLLGGRAGDILGLRRLFVAGLVVFTVASLAGGLAPTPWWLLACRALQGIGAAAASPAALSLIATTFPEGAPRNRALGAYTAIAGIGGPLGLVAGGVVATYLSWRWVFFLNVPIGLAIVALAPRALDEAGRRHGRFDLPGALTGTLGVTLLVYGFISAATDPRGVPHWTDPAVVGTFTAAAALVVAFLLVERFSRAPLVPLPFFADRQRTGTYVVLTLESVAMFGVYFFMTLYLQRVWGYSALRTALVYVPLSLLLMAAAKVSSKVVGRVGPGPLVLGGLAVAAAGLAWLSRIDSSGGFVTGLLLPTVVTYAGFGVTGVPLTLTALEAVPKRDSGLASGLFSTSRQVGGAIGLAVLGTVAWAGAAAGVPADRVLAIGAGRGFALAAGVTALALVVAAVTVRRVASPRPADR
jgi:EmrB/QacA subfamily drug resistance transporter